MGAFIGNVASMGAVLGLDAGPFKDGVRDVIRNIERASTQIITPTAAIATSFSSAALAITKVTTESAEYARQTRNLSAELGLSFQQMRTLQEQGDITGVSIRTLQQASWRLASSLDGMQMGGNQAAKALKELGVSAAQDSGPLILELIEKLSQVENATDRIALAHQVFGRASYQIIPLINQYAELKRTSADLGNVIGDQAAAGLIKAQEEIAKTEVMWERLKQALALTFAPSITTFVEGLRNQLQKLKDQYLTPETDVEKGMVDAEINRRQRSGSLKGGHTVLFTERQEILAQIRQQIAEGAKAVEAANKQSNDILLEQDVTAAKKRRDQILKDADGVRQLLQTEKQREKDDMAALMRGADLQHAGKPLEAGSADLKQKQADLIEARNNIQKYEAMLAAMDPDAAFRREHTKTEALITEEKRRAEAEKFVLDQQEKNRQQDVALQLHYIDTIEKNEQDRSEQINKVLDDDLAARQNYVNQRKDQVNNSLATENSYLTEELMAIKKFGKTGLQAQASILAEMSKAKADADKQIQELEFQSLDAINDHRRRGQEEDYRQLNEAINKAMSLLRQANEEQQRMEHDRALAARTVDDSIMQHEIRNLEVRREAVRFDEEQGRVSRSARLREELAIIDQETEAQKRGLERQRKDILSDESEEGTIKRASRLAAIEREELALADKRSKAQTELRMEEARGLDSVDVAVKKLQADQRTMYLDEQNSEALFHSTIAQRIQDMEILRTRVDALKITQQGFQGVWTSTFEEGKRAMSGIGNSIAGLILDTKNFTAAWKSALNSIEKEILGIFIQSLLKLAIAHTFLATTATTSYAQVGTAGVSAYSAIGIAAAASSMIASTVAAATDEQEIMGEAAVGAAAAAASTAAIPIVGPALAPAAAAAMYTFIASFAALAGASNALGSLAGTVPTVTSSVHFAEGGDVPHDMLAMVHGGEHVLNPDISAALRSAISNGGIGGGTLLVSFAGAHFHGVPSKELVNPFMNAVVSRLRAARVPGF